MKSLRADVVNDSVSTLDAPRLLKRAGQQPPQRRVCTVGLMAGGNPDV